MFFVLFSILGAVLYNLLIVLPLLVYLGVIFIDSTMKNKSLYIGFISIAALFIQFFGYGIAFLKSSILIKLLKRDPVKQFPKLFFK